MKEEIQNSGSQIWSSTFGVQAWKSVLSIQSLCSGMLEADLVYRKITVLKHVRQSLEFKSDLSDWVTPWKNIPIFKLKKKYKCFKKQLTSKYTYTLPHKLQVFAGFTSPLLWDAVFLLHLKFSSLCYKILPYTFIQTVT